MNKQKVVHKRVGSCNEFGRGEWWTLCGYFGEDSNWVNYWKGVTCKKCLKQRGSSRDFLVVMKKDGPDRY